MPKNTERTKKNKTLRKLLAGFYRKSIPIQEERKKEREKLKKMRGSLFFRTRPRLRLELLKGRNKREVEKLRKEEEALGITAIA
jgi:phosphoserine phosphatase